MFFEVRGLTYHSPITIDSLTWERLSPYLSVFVRSLLSQGQLMSELRNVRRAGHPWSERYGLVSGARRRSWLCEVGELDRLMVDQ